MNTSSISLHDLDASDIEAVLALTIATFGPFIEGTARDQLGPVIHRHQHHDWRGDYRRELSHLDDPDHGRRITVARLAGGPIVGFVAWSHEPDKAEGGIEMLAVDEAHRGLGVGTALGRHVLDQLRTLGARVCGVGTGGVDDFHAPARRLYERLGGRKILVAHYLFEV